MKLHQSLCNMASDNRYLTLDSSGFGDSFPANNAFEFHNMLYPPLDNRDGDLELCVVDVSLVGNQGIAPMCFDIQCDLIEPYQHNDGMSQTVATVLPQPKLRTNTLVTNDMPEPAHRIHYRDKPVPSHPLYYRMRKTHTEFDRFTTIKLRVEKTFATCISEEAAAGPKTTYVSLPYTQRNAVRFVKVKGRYANRYTIRKINYVPTPVKVDLQRTIVRLHIRKTQRPAPSEAKS
jgi:hypothetical protein